MIKRSWRLVIAVVIALGIACVAEAAVDYTWNASGDGVFHDSANWSPVGVPGAGDNVTFDATSTFNCSVTGECTVANFTMADGYTGIVTLSSTPDEDLTVTDTITINDGKLTGNNRTINFVNAYIASEDGRLNRNEYWYQTASGTMRSTHYNNTLTSYELADGITATITGVTYLKRLVLGTNSAITGSTLIFRMPATTVILVQPHDGNGDPLATISSSIDITYLRGARSMGPFTITGNVSQSDDQTQTLTMTGDWDISGTLMIRGGGASATGTLDADGHNLTVGSYLRLGNSTTTDNGGKGRIYFGSGTHTITGNMSVYPDTQTYGYFVFGEGTVKVGGNVDFRRADVTAGTGTVELIGAGAQTLYGVTCNGSVSPLCDEDHLDTIPFYNLTINNTGEDDIILANALVVSNDLTITDGDLNVSGQNITANQLVVTNGANSVLTFSNGMLSVKSGIISNGLTTVIGDGANSATLDLWGRQPFNVTSNLVFTNGATLMVEVGGATTNDCNFLDVHGTLTFYPGTTLALSLTNDYTPLPGSYTTVAIADTLSTKPSILPQRYKAYIVDEGSRKALKIFRIPICTIFTVN